MIYFILMLSDYKATEYNNVGLTITSYGVVGNNFSFQVDLPSFEYPLGSRTEHLTLAGLWVGAININGDTLVTTGAIDQYAGSTVSGEGFEFFKQDSVSVYSSLPTSPYYDPLNAFSEQDLVSSFNDFTGTAPEHNPLNIEVNLRAFLWTYSYIDDIVFLRFTIINRSGGDLTNVYIGWFSELVTGNRDFWGDQFARTPFFQHKRVFFVDSLSLVWEKNDGFDTLATSMAGFQFLGYVQNDRKVVLADSVSFLWFQWDPNANRTDVDRYRYMASDTIYPNVDDEYLQYNPYPDPVELIAFGPIDYIPAGDSVVVYMAAVGGLNERHLLDNAAWALRAFQYDFVLPAPPPSPRMVAIPDENRVTLYWENSPEDFVDPFSHEKDFEGYKVLRGLSEVYDSTWIVLRQFDMVDSIGYDAGMPQVTNDCPEELGVETCYYFEDVGVKNGFRYYYSVTSFDRGNREMGIPVLESSYRQNLTEVIPGARPNLDKPIRIYPNPFRYSSMFGGVYIANIPARARIYIYDVSGNLIRTIEHDDPNRGEALWDLKNSSGFPVAPGLYVVVVQDLNTGRKRVARLGIIR